MEITVLTVLMLLGVGLVAGITAGFIGVGGGIIMVPVLLELFRVWDIPAEIMVQAAMGTSLAVATFSTASSAFRHHKQENVLWKLVPLLAIFSFAGSWLASALSITIPGVILQISLAVILLLIAVKMYFDPPAPDREMKNLSVISWILLGFFVGAFAGLTGLAGGVVLIPAMAFFAYVPVRNLAGTSSAVVCFSSFASALQKLTAAPSVDPGAGFVGFVNVVVVLALVITSIPGAQLGAKLNQKAGSTLYKRIFALLLVAVVVRLMLTAR